jgi:purine-binding chemotaxis protein CheW
MRPLPVEALSDMPSFVAGLSLIRGRPTPVIDARKLLGSPAGHAPGRYVTLDVGTTPGERVAALAVDAVIGIRSVPERALAELPGLLRGDEQSALVTSLGTLDSALLLVLEGARLLPQALWQRLEQESGTA